MSGPGKRFWTRSATAAVVAGALTAAGCGPAEGPRPEDPKDRAEIEGKLGGGLGNILGGGGDEQRPASGIAVNSYLWRASLDTMSFMPLASADPFGGVIITDWYSPSDSPRERFKVNLYILGRQLRADGLRAAVFRQVKGPQGTWQDAEVDAQTATKLENAILARARELRIASAETEE